MGEKEIYQWLYQAREAGLSDMKIVTKLRNQGWSHDQIDKILVGAYSENTPVPKQSQKEKIFSPAEKFQKEQINKKDPLDKLKNYHYTGSIGNGSFKKLWILYKNNRLQFVILYIMLLVCLCGIIFTPESMIFVRFIFLILTPLISFLALIMITKNKWSIIEATKEIFPIIFKYLYTLFLSIFVMMGGFILLFIPGIMISISFTMLPYIIIRENKFGFAALERALELTKGHKKTIFLYGLLFIFLISIIFGVLFGGLFILLNLDNISDSMLNIASFGTILTIGLIYALSIITSFAFFKSFYDDLSHLNPSDDLANYTDKSKNKKFYLSILWLLGLLVSIAYIYFSISGVKSINLNNIKIGTEGLLEDNIELVKLPFTYTAPSNFKNDFNNKYKNGYTSTYVYEIPNTSDSININIYLEKNNNKLTAEEYFDIDESILESIYDTSTILSEGKISVDDTDGYFIEKTYVFINSKKYSNKIVYIKKDYIIEISLECASLYYLDYKNLFISSLSTLRIQ